MLDILIVEDNKEIGGLLETFLRNENYVVSVVEAGVITNGIKVAFVSFVIFTAPILNGIIKSLVRLIVPSGNIPIHRPCFKEVIAVSKAFLSWILRFTGIAPIPFVIKDIGPLNSSIFAKKWICLFTMATNIIGSNHFVWFPASIIGPSISKFSFPMIVGRYKRCTKKNNIGFTIL